MSLNRMMQLTLLSLGLNGVCIALTLVWIMQTPHAFASLDVSHVLKEASTALAKAYPKGEVPREVMAKVLTHIQKVTADYGDSHHLTVLAKGAIVSGSVPDITAHVLESLHP